MQEQQVSTGLKAWSIYPSTNTIRLVFYDHKPEVVTYSAQPEELQLQMGLSYEECLFLLGDTAFKQEYEKIVETQKENEKIRDLIEGNLPNGVYQENGLFYLEGIPVSIPDIILKGMKEDEKWINFWKWVALIPYPKNRENFYNYVRNNKLHITEEGNVVGFRKAYKREDLYNFVIETYEKLDKAKKKKSLFVNLNCDIVESSGINIYLLPELYKEFKEKGVPYLSEYQGKKGKTFYYLGFETRIAEEECDFSETDCSRGLMCSPLI